MERAVVAGRVRNLVPSQLLKCWLCRLFPQALWPTCSFSKTSLRPVACGVLQHPSSSQCLESPTKSWNPTNFPMWKGISGHTSGAYHLFRLIHPKQTPSLHSSDLQPAAWFVAVGTAPPVGKNRSHMPRWKNTPPTPPYLSLAIIPPTTEAQIGVQHLTKKAGRRLG